MINGSCLYLRAITKTLYSQKVNMTSVNMKQLLTAYSYDVIQNPEYHETEMYHKWLFQLVLIA